VRVGNWQRCLTLVVVAVAVTVVGVSLRAEALDKGAETAAVEFARTHHPELASLLEQLKKSAPKEYQAAITDLDRSRERLERNRTRIPERYELELAEWKVNSRIRLLVAKMSMSGDAPLDAELLAALRERVDIRLELLKDERERTAKRLERLDEQIAEQKSRADDVVERELATIRKGITSAAAKAAKSRETGVPAAKPAAPKTDPQPRTSKPGDKPESKPKQKSLNKKPDQKS